MKYESKLLIRILLALAIPYYLFQIILTPITISLLKIINFNIQVNNNIFIINNIHLIFIPACAAISAYYLIFILTIFTKDLSLKKSLMILATGFSLILAMNLFRIEILFFILNNYGIDLFNKVHLLFWDIVSTVYVALVWIFIINRFKIKNIPFYSDIKELTKKFKNR